MSKRSTRSLALAIALLLAGIGLFVLLKSDQPVKESPRDFGIERAQMLKTQARTKPAVWLGDAVETLLSNRFGYLPAEAVPQLHSVSVEELNRRFAWETNLVAQGNIALVMALLGDKDSVALLVAAVTEPRAPRALTIHEENAAYTMLVALGFLATNDDKAWAFLNAAVDPAFWIDRIKWETYTGSKPIESLVTTVMESIGLSNHKEAESVLLNLRSSVVPKYPDYDLHFALASAAYDLHYVQTHTAEAKRNYLYHRDTPLREFRAWKNGSNGIPWALWVNEVQRSRGLAEIPISAQ